MNLSAIKKSMLFLLLIAVCLIALYNCRFWLIRTTFNYVMEPFSIQLVTLSKLQLGWQKLTIEQVVLDIQGSKQRLNKLQFSYNPWTRQLHSLHLQQALVTLPAQSRTTDSPLLFDQLLASLMSAPLESVIIERLSIYPTNVKFNEDPASPDQSATASPPLKLIWQQHQGQQTLNLNVAESSVQLWLDSSNTSHITAKIRLSKLKQQLLNIDLTLEKNNHQYQLYGQAALLVRPAINWLANDFSTYLRLSGTFIMPDHLFPPALTADGELHLQIQGVVDNNLLDSLKQPLKVSLQPTSSINFSLQQEGPTALQFDAALNWQTAITLELSTRPEDQGTYHGQSTETATSALLNSQTTNLLLTAKDVQFRLQEHRHNVHTEALFSNIACQLQLSKPQNTDWESHCQLDTAITAPLLQFAGVTVRDGVAKLPINLTINPRQLTVLIAPTQLLTGRQFSLANTDTAKTAGSAANSLQRQTKDIVLQQPTFNNSKPLTLVYLTDDNSLAADLPQLSINLPGISIEDYQITTQLRLSDGNFFLPLNENITAGSSTGKFQLQADSINIRQQVPTAAAPWLPALALKSSISIKQNQLSTEATVLTDQQKTLITINASHHFNDASGQATFSTDSMTFAKGHTKLSKLFSSWPFKADVQKGTLTMTADINWLQQKKIQKINGQLNLQLQQLTGFYQNFAFIGLDADINMRLQHPWQFISSKPLQISLAALDIGLPLHHLELSLQADSSKRLIQLQRFNAQLLGGSIGTSNITYIAGAEYTDLPLTVTNVQIKDILALADYDNVEGTGAISGLLPLTIGPRGLQIRDGQLAGQQPGGILRYHPDATATNKQSNSALQLTTQALSNYHYDQLTVSTQYSPQGDLNLGMRLKGFNPDMNKGQAINLNLNISDNIPSLLRSLQAGRDISEAIERNLKINTRK